MDLKLLSVVALVNCLITISEGQQNAAFCEAQKIDLMPSTAAVTVMLRTSYPSNGPYDYSNDNGDCGCRITATEMGVAMKVSSRLTIPNRPNKSDNKGNSTCGPVVMTTHRKSETERSVLSFQCPLIPDDNDTATYFLDIGPMESIMFALINQQRNDVRSQFNITVLRGSADLQCGQKASVSGCPCANRYYYDGPTLGDAKLASRFIAAIVASVGFLVLCGIIFCIYIGCRNRRLRKMEEEEDGRLPQKSKVDGSENQAYSGSQKSIPDSKPPKPDKKPRTKFSPEKTPEKPTNPYIPYSSEDALNLSLQQPHLNTSPTGIGSIIGTADVRGSTESGIYSSADLIGPDQMYGPNGTPKRGKPVPLSRSKEEIEAMYAKPHKDYYSNVPGSEVPNMHQTAALPPRSASQERLDNFDGRRAGSQERLDQTPMTYRTPSQDRLDRDNAAFAPERKPHHSSKGSLDETDV